MPFTDRAVEVDGRRVVYNDVGEGNLPVLLLHGAAFDHAEMTWRSTVEALRDRRRFIVPDIPGYGDSAPLDAPAQSIPLLGRWVFAFLDALGIKRVDISGVSMGGGMALWCALEAPARIRRLVPVASYGIMSTVPFHPIAQRLARAGLSRWIYRVAASSRTLTKIGLTANYASARNVTDDAIDDVMAVARRQADRETFQHFLNGEIASSGVATDLTPRLGDIGVPTLFIHGESDPIVPVRHARRAASLVPDARLEVLPTGHWPMRERPDLFLPIFGGFLEAN